MCRSGARQPDTGSSVAPAGGELEAEAERLLLPRRAALASGRPRGLREAPAPPGRHRHVFTPPLSYFSHPSRPSPSPFFSASPSLRTWSAFGRNSWWNNTAPPLAARSPPAPVTTTLIGCFVAAGWEGSKRAEVVVGIYVLPLIDRLQLGRPSH